MNAVKYLILIFCYLYDIKKYITMNIQEPVFLVRCKIILQVNNLFTIRFLIKIQLYVVFRLKYCVKISYTVSL